MHRRAPQAPLLTSPCRIPRALSVLVPGVINYKDARIQLLDLPGIIEGAAKGKGRGRQVIGVARTSDLVIMMVDAGKAEIQKELLRMELDAVGIRINQRRPNITIKHKKTGGVSVTSTCGDLTHIDVHQARNILHLYKIHNVDVLIREDITIDEFNQFTWLRRRTASMRPDPSPLSAW
jgi:ribosome-interacting GTPase 1